MKRKIQSVLVTEGDTKHALGIVRALGLCGLRVYILVESKWAQSRLSRYCYKDFILQQLDFDTIFDIVVENKIDLIMPVGTESQKFFSKHRASFDAVSNLFISTEQHIALAMDKQRTYDFAESIGVPIPKTIYPKSVSDLEEIATKITYPCVIKWLYEVGGNIVEYGYNKEDLLAKYMNICQRYGFDEQSGLPMIQEYITGKGVGHFALYRDGVPLHSYQHIRLREAPPNGGASAAARTIKDQQLAEYSHRILKALKWNGVAMVEFKQRADGSLVLMEINPKFWGSFDLGFAAAVNFPYDIVRVVQGDTDPEDTYEVGRSYHWPLDGDLKFSFYSPRRFFSVILDLLNPKTKSNLWLLKDPKPTLMKLAILCGGPIYKLVRKKSL